jgi:hypothetical protein
MVGCYIRILRVVGKSTKVWTRKLHGQNKAVVSAIAQTSPTKVKTAKLAMTIILVFAICWTPYMALTLIEIYSNGRFRIPAWCDGVLQMICLLQSGLNPFIYLAFKQKRKYSPVLILAAAASTYSQKRSPRTRVQRLEGSASMSFCSLGEKPTRELSSPSRR